MIYGPGRFRRSDEGMKMPDGQVIHAWYETEDPVEVVDVKLIDDD